MDDLKDHGRWVDAPSPFSDPAAATQLRPVLVGVGLVWLVAMASMALL